MDTLDHETDVDPLPTLMERRCALAVVEAARGLKCGGLTHQGLIRLDNALAALDRARSAPAQV